MCGRYATTRPTEELVEMFDVDERFVDGGSRADWNMAPTKTAPVVLARPPRDEPDAPPAVQLRQLSWGLVPSWAKDPKIRSKMINARAETVAEKPAYRSAFAKRRGLAPADGFFEWLPTEQTGRSGKPLKQPFFIHPKDGQILALAAIYEFWRDPEKAKDDPEAWLTSYSVITTTATDDVGRVHDRMPMTVTPDRWAEWMDPDIDADTAASIMAPPSPGSLEIYAVSKIVNNVKNNGPELLDPLPESD